MSKIPDSEKEWREFFMEFLRWLTSSGNILWINNVLSSLRRGFTDKAFLDHFINILSESDQPFETWLAEVVKDSLKKERKRKKD
jgi:hypothetical protein